MATSIIFALLVVIVAVRSIVTVTDDRRLAATCSPTYRTIYAISSHDSISNRSTPASNYNEIHGI